MNKKAKLVFDGISYTFTLEKLSRDILPEVIPRREPSPLPPLTTITQQLVVGSLAMILKSLSAICSSLEKHTLTDSLREVIMGSIICFIFLFVPKNFLSICIASILLPGKFPLLMMKTSPIVRGFLSLFFRQRQHQTSS